MRTPARGDAARGPDIYVYIYTRGRGEGEEGGFLQRSASFIPSWAVLYKTVCCVGSDLLTDPESICFGRASGRPRALRRVRGLVASARTL